MKDKKIIGAKVYLYSNDALIQKVTYLYEDGTESSPLHRYIHLGMYTDSVLFGKDDYNIRFFVYPSALKLYDTDVDRMDFVNGADTTVHISGFGKELVLAPNESGQLRK